MNKSDFIARVAEHQSISKTAAKEIVDNVINEIADVIKERDSVYFTELGTFGVKFKEAHESRNPATGETINVDAKYVPDFKFGKQIKNALKGVGVDAD